MRDGEKPRTILGDLTSSAFVGGTTSAEDPLAPLLLLLLLLFLVVVALMFFAEVLATIPDDVVSELDPVDRPDCSPVGGPVVSVFALAVVVVVDGDEADGEEET